MKNIQNRMEVLLQYRDVLHGTDREIFDKLIEYANGQTNNLTTLESLLISLVIEQQKRIQEMRVHG